MSVLTRRRFLAICAACLAAPATASPIRWRGFALGAEISLTIHAPQDQAQQAIRLTKTRLRDIEKLFSLYDPSSTLSALNRSGKLRHPPAQFQRLMQLCDKIHAATHGCFDPTVQSLWQTSPKPRSVGWEKVTLSPSVMLGKGQQITLNGIAQGYATDLIRDAFQTLGLTSALINIGEFSALGGPFRLGLADPDHGIFATRTLQNQAIATSSPKAMQLRGAAHIRHPKGIRKPLWSTVSVQAQTAALADALSTAFCVMPKEEIQSCLARMPAGTSATLLHDNQQTIRL